MAAAIDFNGFGDVYLSPWPAYKADPVATLGQFGGQGDLQVAGQRSGVQRFASDRDMHGAQSMPPTGVPLWDLRYRSACSSTARTTTGAFG